MTAEIISAGIGAFIGWALTKTASLVIRRNRLRNYLHICFQLRFAEMRDNGKWLARVLGDLTLGTPGESAPRYTRNDLGDIAKLRETSVELLTQVEMRRVAKCHAALWELEVLFEGFCWSLSEHQKARQTSVDLRHLQKRGDRIAALIAILPTDFRTIDDLPDDYSGRISAVTLVPDSSTPARPSPS